MTSLRIAQPIHGLGLLEVIPEAALLRIAESQKALGFNGRPNYVQDDLRKTKALGRFRWKANQPGLAQQIAAAYAGDLGVTSSLYPDMNCPPVQADCAAQPPVNQSEFIDNDWEQVIFWARTLAVSARRNTTDPRFKRGEMLFAEAKCSVWHVSELRTEESVPYLEVAQGQRVRAYTDPLLHDMGDELADGRPDFRVEPRDWRTQPVWGLGLSEIVAGSTAMLHDGRARTVTDAILWQGDRPKSRAARSDVCRRPIGRPWSSS